MLLSAGHKNTYNAVLAERLNTKRSYHRAVLTSRYTNNGIAALTVIFKKVSYPIHTIVFDLFSIKHFKIPLSFNSGIYDLIISPKLKKVKCIEIFVNRLKMQKAIAIIRNM
jgi:hypothetical protein